MFSKTSAITFDVGRSCIHACQLQSRRGAARVSDKLRFELSHAVSGADKGAADAGKTGNATGSKSPIDCDRLARLVGQAQFTGTDVALVLSPPDVRFHSTKLGEGVLRQSPDRIRAAVAFEAAREARVDPAELEVRYWPLPHGHSLGHNIMAMSMQTKWAMQWFEQLRKQKLFLRRIDGSPCAMTRFAAEAVAPQERDLWAVLDLGFQQSVLTLVLGNTPVYVRVLSSCADAWTRRLAQAFENEYAEAEALKRTHGISASANSRDTGRSDELSRSIFDLLRTDLDGIVRELDMCCSYVVQSFSDVEMRRVVICGGGAGLRGLDEFLTLHLGIPVELLGSRPISDRISATERGRLQMVFPADPLAHQPAEFACAFGAALLDLEAA